MHAIDLDLTTMGYRCIRCQEFKGNDKRWQIWIDRDITKYRNVPPERFPLPFNRGYREWVNDKLLLWFYYCNDCADILRETKTQHRTLVDRTQREEPAERYQQSLQHLGILPRQSVQRTPIGALVKNSISRAADPIVLHFSI